MNFNQKQTIGEAINLHRIIPSYHLIPKASSFCLNPKERKWYYGAGTQIIGVIAIIIVRMVHGLYHHCYC